MHVGPVAETRTAQKLASTGLFVAFAVLVVVSALDHRFGWSTVPTAVSLGGDVLVAIGFGIGILTVSQNSYAAANITVKADQRVISTGLYGFVRHPMYFSAVIMMIGIPLALVPTGGWRASSSACPSLRCASTTRRTCSNTS
ncbi:MAG: hypothetical protein QOH91_1977 [Mycobacterium sp.]|jgi:protein-S-isoprenylcysteine O-methyltransferase Ste14|nr:hypothetical protein [Mycobacterium sp.]